MIYDIIIVAAVLVEVPRITLIFSPYLCHIYHPTKITYNSITVIDNAITVLSNINALQCFYGKCTINCS